MELHTSMDLPLGVLRRILTCNSSKNVSAPQLCFIKNTMQITFGSSPKRDVIIDSVHCGDLSAIIKWGLNMWRLSNEGCKQLSLNEKKIEIGETLILKSGDKIRFGWSENLDITYIFILYSKDNPPLNADIQNFIEAKIRELEKVVDYSIENIKKLKTQLDALKQVEISIVYVQNDEVNYKHPWMTFSVKAQLNLRSKAYKRMKKNPTEENINNWITIRKITKSLTRKLQRQYLNTKFDKAENDSTNI